MCFQPAAKLAGAQRKLVKAMEDCKVSYDHSVRDSSGHIIQFLYGEAPLPAPPASEWRQQQGQVSQEQYQQQALPNTIGKATIGGGGSTATVARLGLASLQNCAFINVDGPIEPLTWIMDMLMLGVGVTTSLSHVSVPVKWPVPFTSSLYNGFVLPMPTLPLGSNIMMSLYVPEVGVVLALPTRNLIPVKAALSRYP